MRQAGVPRRTFSLPVEYTPTAGRRPRVCPAHSSGSEPDPSVRFSIASVSFRSRAVKLAVSICEERAIARRSVGEDKGRLAGAVILKIQLDAVSYNRRHEVSPPGSGRETHVSVWQAQRAHPGMSLRRALFSILAPGVEVGCSKTHPGSASSRVVNSVFHAPAIALAIRICCSARSSPTGCRVA